MTSTLLIAWYRLPLNGHTPLFQDLPGEYSVTLTINGLQKEDVGRENELIINNDEGSTTYKFILEIGSKPPSGNL